MAALLPHRATPSAHNPRHPLLQASQQLRDRCHAFLLTQLPPELREAAEAAAGRGSSVQEGSGMEVDEEEGGAVAPGRWGIAPFYVEQRPQASAAARFNFRAPTTGRNALRVLRALQVGMFVGWAALCWGSCLPQRAAFSAATLGAEQQQLACSSDWSSACSIRCCPAALPTLQLRKPILLEGSPGVGKTSLVAAMAKAVGESRHA